MKWPPKIPRGFQLTVTKDGYIARIGGVPKWICGKKPPDEALAIYHRKAAAIATDGEPLAVPTRGDDNPPLHYILNRWIHLKQSAAKRDELSLSAFRQFRLSAKRIDKVVGHFLCDDVNPDMVHSLYERLAEKYSVDFAKRSIGHLRACCRDAADMGWCRPVRLGDRLIAKLASRPAPTMKWRLYTRAEIRRILCACVQRIRQRTGVHKAAWIQLRAMILLALNGGYGATELAELPRAVVDLKNRRIDHARGKTGEEHIVPLWPETIRALRKAMKLRPDDELLFRTQSGTPWCWRKPVMKGDNIGHVLMLDSVNERFTELVEPIGLKFKGVGFYKLKHLANTTADAAGDPHATFALFGHALPGAKSHYVKVGLDRVERVVEYMRVHLITSSGESPTSKPQEQNRGS